MKNFVKVFSFFFFIRQLYANCSFHCEAYDCPCECIKKEIRCGDRNVTDIYNFPRHVEYQSMDFGNNQITSIKRNHFAKHHVQKVYTLQLSDNEIREVEDYSFSVLRHLTSLYLNTNRIEVINEYTLVGLNKLKRLYLNDNKIKALVRKIFEPFKNTLLLLYLQDNRIHFIEENTLRGFAKLRILDLSGNQITTLDSGLWYAAPNLVHLFLSNNPWVCDEATVCVLYGGIHRRQVTNAKVKLNLHGGMQCKKPEKYRSKEMSEVTQLLQCDKVNYAQKAAPTLVKDADNSKGKHETGNTLLVLGCLLAWVFAVTIRTTCR